MHQNLFLYGALSLTPLVRVYDIPRTRVNCEGDILPTPNPIPINLCTSAVTTGPVSVLSLSMDCGHLKAFQQILSDA